MGIFGQESVRTTVHFGQQSAFFGTQIRTTVRFGQESASENSPVTIEFDPIKTPDLSIQILDLKFNTYIRLGIKLLH